MEERPSASSHFDVGDFPLQQPAATQHFEGMRAAETSDGVHWNAATWIDDDALDMIRTSSFSKGGITGALKIAHLAESHAMKAEVHRMGVPNAHLCAAIPNNDFYEQLVHSTDHIASLGTRGELPIMGGQKSASAPIVCALPQMFAAKSAGTGS